jgi:hypothetical protein
MSQGKKTDDSQWQVRPRRQRFPWLIDYLPAPLQLKTMVIKERIAVWFWSQNRRLNKKQSHEQSLIKKLARLPLKLALMFGGWLFQPFWQFRISRRFAVPSTGAQVRAFSFLTMLRKENYDKK